MRGWATVPFEEACTDVSRGNTKVPQVEYANSGSLAVVDQGESDIAGYVDTLDSAFRGPTPVIVFGDHTRRFKFVDFPFALGADGVRVLVANDGVDPRYLFHYLRTVNIPSPGYSRHFKFLKRCNVPLPPLDEQRRIVQVLDATDALRATRRVGASRLEELKAALFVDGFGGHHQSPITVGERLDEHPRGWGWELLTDVARLATGHTPDRGRAEYWGGGVPWITLTDIRQLDGKVALETSETVSDEGIRRSSAVRLPPGTICFSRTASVGFVTMAGRELATSQDFVNWVCGPTLDPTYLMHAFQRSKARLRALSNGSTHKTIYFPTVERFRVLVPPVKLQQDFAQKMEKLMQAEARVQDHLAYLDDLFASLQSRAFAGEL